MDVDTDGDGQFDYILSINHDKEPGVAQRVSTDILSETDHVVYEVRPGDLGSIGTFDASLTGSTFTFDVDSSAFPQFAPVSSASSGFWVTAYRNGDAGQTCWDRWP